MEIKIPKINFCTNISRARNRYKRTENNRNTNRTTKQKDDRKILVKIENEQQGRVNIYEKEATESTPPINLSFKLIQPILLPRAQRAATCRFNDRGSFQLTLACLVVCLKHKIANAAPIFAEFNSWIVRRL